MLPLWSKQPKQKIKSASSAIASFSVIMDMDLQITESKANILMGLKSYFDFFNFFLSKGKQPEFAHITQ